MTFQNKEPLSPDQIASREKALGKIQNKLDTLKDVLDRAGHDNELYLNKVIAFYQKMVANWKEDVSSINSQDIRDLQEDVAKITHAVYLPDMPYIPTPTPREQSSFDFFGGSLSNTVSMNYSALAAQPIGLLP